MCLPPLLPESHRPVPSQSRRVQQRARREERVQRGARDLLRGLAALAPGLNLALGPQDRLRLEGQVRQLEQELREGAAAGNRHEWRRLRKLRM